MAHSLRKLCLFGILVLLNVADLSAQTCTTISMADTIRTCPNTTVALSATLSVPPNYTVLDTTWSPASGLSDTSSLTPTATIGTSSKLYKLNIQTLTPQNQVYNGDFSLGDTGFNSSYTYATGPNSLYPEGLYTVTTNPTSVHPAFATIGDHTTGTGNMMVINGASSAVSIWCQTISVIPNTYYDFSAWGTSVTSSNPAVIQFSINGSLVGTPLSLSSTTGQWDEFHVVWYSGSNTSITICITDQQTATGGNDFALDDISFREICKSVDSVYIDVANLKDSIVSDQQPCLKGKITLRAQEVPGFIAATKFKWIFGDGTSSALTATDTIEHTYSSPNAYPVKLILYGTSGCHDSITEVVNVHNFPPPIARSNDTSVCPGDSVQLWVDSAVAYSWSPANTLNNTHVQAPIATPDSTTTYYVTVQLDSFCTTKDSIKVNVYTPPNVVAAYNGDLISCLHPTTQLQATGAISYRWMPGNLCDDSLSASPNVSPLINTEFVVIGTDAHDCKNKDSVMVNVSDIADVFVPSAFTPNGDGKNDKLVPISYCGFTLEYFEIYNRWGQRVFYSMRDQRPAWDGTLFGAPCPIDTYYYYVKGISREGREIVKKGTIELIR